MGKNNRLKPAAEDYYARLAEKAEKGTLIVTGKRFYGRAAALRKHSPHTGHTNTPEPDRNNT